MARFPCTFPINGFPHLRRSDHNARISMSVSVIVTIITFGGATVITIINLIRECIMVTFIIRDIRIIRVINIIINIILSRRGDTLLLPGPLRWCHKTRGNHLPTLKSFTGISNRL